MVLSLNASFAQNQSTAKYFAQCHFVITDNNEMVAFNETMKLNTNIEMVRLDHNTQRALILTHGLSDFTEQDLISWFGIHGSTLTCVQIGVYGVDTIEPYPFTNCQ